MNPEHPSNPREELELRVTSLLLGELSEAEAAEVRDAIANDPELKKLHDDLKQTIHLVREATVSAGESAQEESDAPKLPEEKRQQLLTAFVIPPLKPEHVKRKPRARFTLIELLAVIAIVGVLAGLLLPTGGAAKRKARSAQIQNNLRLLDSAKQQWALEHNELRSDAAPTLEELKPYLGRGADDPLPTVSGEKYVVGKMNEPVAAEMDDKQAKQMARVQGVVTSTKGTRGAVYLSDEGGLSYAAKAPSQYFGPSDMILAATNDGDRPNLFSEGASYDRKTQYRTLSSTDPSSSSVSTGPETRRVLVATNVTVQNFVADNSKPWTVSAGTRGFYDDILSTKLTPAIPAQEGLAENRQTIETLSREPDLAPPPTEIVLPKSGSTDSQGVQVANSGNIQVGQGFFTSGGHGGGGGAGDSSDLYWKEWYRGPKKSEGYNLNSVTLTYKEAASAGEKESVADAGGAAPSGIGSSSPDQFGDASGEQRAKVPGIGRFFRPEATTAPEPATTVPGSQREFGFNTSGSATADPAGNRVHTDEPLPFAAKGTIADSITASSTAVASPDSGNLDSAPRKDIHDPAVSTLTGIRTDPQFKVVEKALAARASGSNDDRRALGFDWYMGNSLMGKTNGFASRGGTAPSYSGTPTAANPNGFFPGTSLLNTIPSAASDQLLTSGLRNTANAPAVASETTATAIQTGKLLFESGHYAEAEAQLNKALEAEPGNYAAAYYSSLIKEKRDANANLARTIQTKERLQQVEKAWAMPTPRERLPVPQPYASTNAFADVGATNGVYSLGIVGYVNVTNQIQPGYNLVGSSTPVAPTTDGSLESAKTPPEVKIYAKFAEVSQSDFAQTNGSASSGRQPSNLGLDRGLGRLEAVGSLDYLTVQTLNAKAIEEEVKLGWEEESYRALTNMNRADRVKALPSIARDTQLTALSEQLDLAQQTLLKTIKDSGADSPNVQNTRKLVEDLQRKVNDRADGVLAGLQTTVEARRAGVDSIRSNLAEAKTNDVQRAIATRPYYDAKRELDNLVTFQKILEQRLAMEKVDVTLPRTSMVTIMNPARPPQAADPGILGRIGHAFKGDYVAKASVKVDRGGADIAEFTSRSMSGVYDPYFIQTEFEAVKSEVVLTNVIARFDLNTRWGTNRSGGRTLKTSETLDLLRNRLDLRPVKNTMFIEIGVKSSKPDEAAELANAVAEAYRDHRLQEIKQASEGGIRTLEARYEEQQKKVQLAQQKVADLRERLVVSEPAPVMDAPLPRKPSTNAPIPQPEILTSDNNFSTFSLNVSDVSFKLAAASLEKGQMPDSASIRSEEFINAFDYRDPEATAGSPVAFAWERARYPFAHNRDLLRFSLKTAAAGRQAGRPLNVVLLLDNSGSMERADRVGIIREALRVLASQLQPQDKLSVITFARTPRLVADGIAGDKAGEVAEQVSGLTPEGGTNLEDAMNLAYQTAAKHFLVNGINRVVLLTDGAANLGNVEPESLKQKVETQRKQGIALDCFGIGWEGFNDDLLEVLSRNGDGRYGFINSPEEAASEFAGQLAGALKVAASDVKVQVEFNPKRVTSYRQIGYAKHQLTKEQFRDNTVDAAEIAAQEAGNALYTVEVNPAGEGPLCTVHVRYKIPGTSDYREQAWEVPFSGNVTAVEQASAAMRLATSASAFSEWLAVSPHASEVQPDALLKILGGVPEAFGSDSRPKKLEWMIRQAKSLEGK